MTKFKDMKKWDTNELRAYVEETDSTFRVVTIRRGKIIESMICRDKEDAEHMAQEYLREEGIRKAWNTVKGGK